jgi:hypothetical protein
MSGNETIVPEQVIGYANALDQAAGPALDAAKAAFEAADIDGGAFSPVGIALAVAYPGSQHWAVNDAQSKHEQLRAITDNMAATAKLWAAAETDNTIVEC